MLAELRWGRVLPGNRSATLRRIFLSNRIILETVEDVNNLDQDFILFIGTSHTVGECQRGDQQHLDQSLVWTEILSSKYNIKYVKLAYGGSENWNILLMLVVL